MRASSAAVARGRRRAAALLTASVSVAGLVTAGPLVLGAGAQERPCGPYPMATVAPGTVLLSRGSDGLTVKVDRGNEVQVQFDCGAERVTVPASSGPELVRESEDVQAGGEAARATFRAAAPGTTTLTSTFRPACRDEPTPCAAPERQWRVQVVVEDRDCGVLAGIGGPRTATAGDRVQVTGTLNGPRRSAEVTAAGYQRISRSTVVPVSPAPQPVTASGTVLLGREVVLTSSARLWLEADVVCEDGSRRAVSARGESFVVAVAPRLGITAVRRAPRDYVFSGEALGRPGLLVSLYRVEADGREVLTSQTRSTADGRWSVRRVFTGSGRFGFLVRTGADGSQAAGASRVRPTVVH